MRKIKFRLIKDDKVVGYEKTDFAPHLDCPRNCWQWSVDNKVWRNDYTPRHDAKEQFTGEFDEKANEIYYKDKCRYWTAYDGDSYEVIIEYQFGAYGFTDPSNDEWIYLHEEAEIEVIGRAKKEQPCEK